MLPRLCSELPDEGVGWENCVEGVLTVRQAVTALGRGLGKGLGDMKIRHQLAAFVLKNLVKLFAFHGSQAEEFSP